MMYIIYKKDDQGNSSLITRGINMDDNIDLETILNHLFSSEFEASHEHPTLVPVEMFDADKEDSIPEELAEEDYVEITPSMFEDIVSSILSRQQEEQNACHKAEQPVEEQESGKNDENVFARVMAEYEEYKRAEEQKKFEKLMEEFMDETKVHSDCANPELRDLVNDSIIRYYEEEAEEETDDFIAQADREIAALQMQCSNLRDKLLAAIREKDILASECKQLNDELICTRKLFNRFLTSIK